MQQHAVSGIWPQIEWTGIRRSLAGQVAMVRNSLAASRAYEEARTDAARRQAMAHYLETIR